MSASAVKSPSIVVNEELLQTAYHECVKKKGFHDFTRKVRATSGASSVKLKSLNNLFKTATTWQNVSHAGGHAKYKNMITHVVVEFKNHNKGDKSTNVDEGAAKTILDQVQRHINILGNEIFQYEWRSPWPEPNYKEAVKAYKTWYAKEIRKE